MEWSSIVEANTADSENRLLTIDEVAQHLRVSVLTVRWLRQEGRFAPAIKIGRRLVWNAADLDRWVRSQAEVAA